MVSSRATDMLPMESKRERERSRKETHSANRSILLSLRDDDDELESASLGVKQDRNKEGTYMRTNALETNHRLPAMLSHSMAASAGDRRERESASRSRSTAH